MVCQSCDSCSLVRVHYTTEEQCVIAGCNHGYDTSANSSNYCSVIYNTSIEVEYK